jgi:hypothetical protein
MQRNELAYFRPIQPDVLNEDKHFQTMFSMSDYR